MDDVIGRHYKPDRLVNRNMKIVIHVPVWILKTPVPLLRNHLDFIGIVGRSPHVQKVCKPPKKDHNQNQPW